MADERDPQVSRRYREMGAEEPSRALDEKILAASRRAVDVHPAPLVAPTGRRRWYFPVAAAAVIMLAVAVTLQIERQKPDEEVVASAPAQARKEAQVETAPAAEQPKPMRAPEPKKKERQFTPEPPPPASQPAAPAPQVATPASQAAELPRELAKSNEQTAGAMAGSRAAEAPAEARTRSDSARDSVAAAPAMQRETRQLESKVETPEAVLERIAELRKQGKHEEADKALAEFRKQYPDYRMSDETRAKVEKK